MQLSGDGIQRDGSIRPTATQGDVGVWQQCRVAGGRIQRADHTHGEGKCASADGVLHHRHIINDADVFIASALDAEGVGVLTAVIIGDAQRVAAVAGKRRCRVWPAPCRKVLVRHGFAK